jgi:hypothetical protein
MIRGKPLASVQPHDSASTTANPSVASTSSKVIVSLRWRFSKRNGVWKHLNHGEDMSPMQANPEYSESAIGCGQLLYGQRNRWRHRWATAHMFHKAR